jgi:hypothetical protein
MVTDVEAQHLLLEGQALRLGEFGLGEPDPRPLPVAGPFLAAPLDRGKERGDAHVVLPPARQRPVDDLVEHQAQPLAGMTHRVEGAALDQ